jgi:DNA-binding NtrC family response regulator
VSKTGQAVKGEKGRILIVDDDWQLSTVLSENLSVLCECATAESAEAAIEVLEENEFGLLLTDIGLPGMSGLALCEFVRRRYPTIAVIVMSMNTNELYASESLRRGAFGFLPKPFETTLLLQMVRAALAQGK